MIYSWLTLPLAGVSFFVRRRLWQHQNAKSLLLNAQSATRETIQARKTLLQMPKELKSTNFARVATNAQNTKKQNKLFFFCESKN